jgi:hypothetical protein
VLPRIARMKTVFSTLLLALVAVPAAAQTLPRVEVGAGYQVQQMASLFLERGWFADLSVRATRRLSVVTEAAGAHDDSNETLESFTMRLETSRSLRMHSGAAGLRVSFQPDSRLVVYLQALGGAAQVHTNLSIHFTNTNPLPPLPGFPDLGLPGGPILFPDVTSTTTKTHASIRMGGGAILRATERLGLRIALDYGGLVGDQSPPGGPRLMGGLSLGL